MALGIYKPGQGYWIRVMTACLIGALTLATVGWLWGQTALVADKLPRASYTLVISPTAATPTPQMSVDLLGPTEGGTPIVIGNSTVLDYQADTRFLRILPPKMVQGREVQEVTSVKDASPTGQFAAGVTPRDTRAQAKVEPLILQGAAASVVILLGALAALWFAGMRPRTVDFLIATDSEMKRVNWSTPREIRGSTYVVIGACFLLAGALFVFDFIFQFFFKTIGVLGN